MSWAQWSAATQPPSVAPTAAVPSVLNPSGSAINPAPAVMPPGMQYTPEQWAQLQQQNWNQWAQWQQQYQQWHQQYGAEYQKSMAQLAASQQPVPSLPNVSVPPPLPAEPKPPLPTEDPPPLTPSYSTAPPPTQPGYNTTAYLSTNEKPLLTSFQKPNQNFYTTQNPRYGLDPLQNKRSYDHSSSIDPNRKPLWQSQPPPPQPQRQQQQHYSQKLSLLHQQQPQQPLHLQPPPQHQQHPPPQQQLFHHQQQSQHKQQIHQQPPPQQQPRPIQRVNTEELSEAEKKFDKQFADWEAQFNKWKEQNVEHPDKEQYKEYEKKWESWRAQLLERREQMKRKRLGLPLTTQANTAVSLSRNSPQQSCNPSLTGPSTNLTLKTGGLLPTPPSVNFNKPPPTMNNDPLKFKQVNNLPEPDDKVEDFIRPNTEGGIPGLDLVKDDLESPMNETDDVVVIDSDLEKEKKGPDLDAISKGINTILGDQKLLSMLSMVSQNSNAKITDNVTNNTSKIAEINPDFIPPIPFHEQSNQSYEEKSTKSEIYGQKEIITNFDDQTRSSFTTGYNDQEMKFDNGNRNLNQFSNKFENISKGLRCGNHENDSARNNSDHLRNERFSANSDFNQNNRFQPGLGVETSNSGLDKFGNKFRIGSQDDRMILNQEKFVQGRPLNKDESHFEGPMQDRFGFSAKRGTFESGNRFEPGQGPSRFEKFGNEPDQDRYRSDVDQGNFDSSRGNRNFGPGLGQDRFANNQDRTLDFGSRFGSNEERFGQNDAHCDRFGDSRIRFDNNSNKFDSNQDRWPEPNRFGQDRFTSNKDNFGSERDKIGVNQENRFQSNQGRFEPPPELRNDRNFNNRDYESGNNYDYEEYDENAGFTENYDDDYDYNMTYDDNNQDLHEDMEEENQEPVWAREDSFQGRAAEEFPGNKDSIPVAPDEPEILKPSTVIDYEHKSLKQEDAEILVEPIYMFDYRHKPLSRIPLPQRPKWLSDAVRNIREFDPPVVRSYEPPTLRRYPPPGDNWRKDRNQEEDWGRGKEETWGRSKEDSWGRNKEDNWGRSKEDNWGRNKEEDRGNRYGRRTYNENRSSFDDHRSYNDRSYEEPKRNRNDNKKDERRSPTFQNMDLEEEKISDTEWPEDEEFANETRKSEGSFSKPKRSDNPVLIHKKNAVLIEDLISPPGRYSRPPRIVIILRGPPGSGKTFLAKLIKDKEVENGGSPPRILSLDDYFMIEQEKEVIEEGKKIKIKEMVYEYEAEMEESYRSSLIKSFKKTVLDGYFPFIIVDNINDKVKYFGEMWSFAKQNGFQVYICQLEIDVQSCSRRNIHDRSEADIEKCVKEWEPTPSHHPTLDATSLLQAASIPDVEMEEVNSPESDEKDLDGSQDQVARSKWDNFDCSVHNLAKLDGVSRPLRHSRTMEEYLQMDTDWTPTKPSKPGQKRVRWADLEEQKQQEKMRAIGFVVGQTNWQRMMDPTNGGSALTQTKYIERTGRYKVDHK